jgi:hypothetical protein
VRRRPARAPRLALALAGCLAAAALPVPARAAPGCRAEAAVEPARAVVGEQVLYRVRIHSAPDVERVEWSHPPAFPHVRTELLPGDPQPAAAAEVGGHVRDERRALFAERPGVHRLRAPGLVCARAAGAPEAVGVPEVSLLVEDPPAEGRPPGFAGQVGPLTIHLTVTPRELALGDSLRVAVMVRGGGNLWLLPPPFAPDAFGAAEVFAEQPGLDLERGRALYLGRHFMYDVVPRQEGVLRVPGIALPYFDPAQRSYRTAETEPVLVRVGPRATAATAPDPGAPARAREPGPDAPRVFSWWMILVPALLLPLAGVWRRRRRASAARAIRPALAAVATAEQRGDRAETAAALERALRAALAAHVPDAASVAPEELAARRDLAPAVAAAAHVLAGLARARFDPGAPPPDGVAVRRAIAEL